MVALYKRLALPALLAWLAVGCSTKLEPIVLHRSNCLVCHTPLNDQGEGHGIEDAHPWYPLECVDCHGGHEWVCSTGVTLETPDGPRCDGTWLYDQELAHVVPDGGAFFVKNLTSGQLDTIDQDYLRFVNPGDFRVAQVSCGGGNGKAGEGGGCHQSAVEEVVRSTMAHTSGEITVARYRAMKQPHPRGIFGGIALTDPNPVSEDLCSVEALLRYDPPPIDVESTDPANAPTVANAQDQYMVKSCFRCHLNDFGENKFPGDFRSSGCTACHMPYADDGLSRSEDPWINKLTVPHPVTHQLTLSPPIEACTHCHYRGGRIGISYQGYRESAGGGFNPPNREVLGRSLHGHDANYYLTDEDTTAPGDETPPDLHFEAGLHCVDCHTLTDVHGDGHLYADTQCAVTSECTDCHGGVREYAAPDPKRNNLFRGDDGLLYLRLKVTGKVLVVPQTLDAVTPGNTGYSLPAKLAMGVNEDGFSHTDKLECYTCHAGWLPSCYGCHVEVDLTREAKYHTTGALVPGRPSGGRRAVQLNDLVLMQNTDGMLAPSMPAERFFMTLLVADPEASAGGGTVTKPLFSSKPRRFELPDGRVIAGFGQRAFNPHTTRRRSQFMACDRCHSVGSADKPTNEVLLDITYGFGSERFPQEGCDVSNEDDSCLGSDRTVYQLDAIQTRTGEPLVVVGHPDPIESRPLTLEEIGRMREVLVPESPLYSTPIPANALTDRRWPAAQYYSD